MGHLPPIQGVDVRSVIGNSPTVRFFVNDRPKVVATMAPSLPSSSSSVPTARLRKGDLTRATIVGAAMKVASREGLEGLTLGGLSETLGMSKSGVFAHFGSREELQLAVLRAYAARFVDEVLRTAVLNPRGLPRLRAIMDGWLNYLSRAWKSGCILIGGASEYDDRNGPVRDAMVELVAGWQEELAKAVRFAIEEGHLQRDVDARQIAFELYGLLLTLHQSARLLQATDAVRRARIGIDRLLSGVTTAAGTRLLKTTPSKNASSKASASRTPRAASSSTSRSKPQSKTSTRIR